MMDLTTQRTTFISFAVFASIVGKYAKETIQIPSINIDIPFEAAEKKFIGFFSNLLRVLHKPMDL